MTTPSAAPEVTTPSAAPEVTTPSVPTSGGVTKKRVFVPPVDELEAKASKLFETVSFVPANSYDVDENGVPKVKSSGHEDPDEEL